MRDDDSSPMPLETRSQAPSRRSLVRFSPEINTGQIWQFVGFLIACALAYGTYTADQARRDMGVEQIKVDAIAQRTAMKESLSELRSDVKDIQRTLVDVSQNMAVMKSRGEPGRKP